MPFAARAAPIRRLSLGEMVLASATMVDRTFERERFALTAAFAAGLTYAPATRTQVLSHNAFPDHGKFADRLDAAEGRKPVTAT